MKGHEKTMAFVAALSLTMMLVVALGCNEKSKVTPLKFLLDWKAGMEYVGFYVADAKGFYREAGMSVKIDEGAGATTSARLIASGKYNLGLSTGDALVIARERGLPIISLAVLFQRTPVVMFSLKKENITRFEDLSGKTIGVSTSDTKYNYYQGLTRRLKLGPGVVKEVAVGFDVAPLLSGQVDALLGYTNVQPVQVELAGHPVNVVPFSKYGFDIYSEAIIVNEQYLKESPDLVRRFVQASLRGWEYAVANPEEAVAILRRAHPEYEERFLRISFQRVVPLLEPNEPGASIGAQTPEGWRKTRDVLREVGLINRDAPIAELYSNDFM